MTLTEEQTEDIVEVEDAVEAECHHAYCEACYPQDNADDLPDWVTAVCGALILTSQIPDSPDGKDVYDSPPNACPVCLVAVVCTKGHMPI